VPESLLHAVAVVLNRTAEGKELLPLSWERAVVVRYLPAGLLTEEVLRRLPPACGVAFVREENGARGFLVSHEGILLGGLTLVHASSRAGEVAAVPLLEHVRGGDGGSSCDGVLFFRFR